MSGFVITRLAFVRISGRSARGVSPSYTAAFTCGSRSDRIARSWSRASAFVGNRYSAVDLARSTASPANATLYTRVLPLAVPVAITTLRPAARLSRPRA
jgi:hypothetical protein